MSRIGKNPIAIPAGVTVEVNETVITVKGKLGQLTQEFSDVTVKIEDNQVIVERSSDQ
jgi:large subunit ribosomal protein L6